MMKNIRTSILILLLTVIFTIGYFGVYNKNKPVDETVEKEDVLIISNSEIEKNSSIDGISFNNGKNNGKIITTYKGLTRSTTVIEIFQQFNEININEESISAEYPVNIKNSSFISFGAYSLDNSINYELYYRIFEEQWGKWIMFRSDEHHNGQNNRRVFITENILKPSIKSINRIQFKSKKIPEKEVVFRLYIPN